MAQSFPRLVKEEDNQLDPISKEELEAILKGMEKDKSSGPDGWTMEFYLGFFDLIWMIYCR